jgi:hypothetical protein
MWALTLCIAGALSVFVASGLISIGRDLNLKKSEVKITLRSKRSQMNQHDDDGQHLAR